MVNVTLSIPADLHAKMKKHSEIRWSEVVRKSLREKISDLDMLERLTSKSRLSGEDAEAIGDKIKAATATRLSL